MTTKYFITRRVSRLETGKKFQLKQQSSPLVWESYKLSYTKRNTLEKAKRLEATEHE